MKLHFHDWSIWSAVMMDHVHVRKTQARVCWVCNQVQVKAIPISWYDFTPHTEVNKAVEALKEKQP